MNRIDQLFQTKSSRILSIYFCAGCPTPDGTAATIQALQEAGVDMIEIGIPFSDPLADGPVIQQAATTALRGGMSLRRLFDQLADIRRMVQIPLLLMGYLNPILQFGFEAFCQRCRACGIDGLIIPDLPLREYREHYQATAERYGLHVVMLVTPETSDERVREIDRHTGGFIYMVSSAAVTGAQRSFDEQKQAYFRRIDSLRLKHPRLVGFGISNKATFEAACRASSGAIIGSRFVTLLSEAGGDAALAIARLKEIQGLRDNASTVMDTITDEAYLSEARVVFADIEAATEAAERVKEKAGEIAEKVKRENSFFGKLRGLGDIIMND